MRIWIVALVCAASTCMAPPTIAQKRSTLAPITAAQNSAIGERIGHAPPNLRGDVEAARPVLTRYLAKLSCITDDIMGKSPLQAELGPGALGLNQIVAPMAAMRNHDRGSCVDGLRLQAWRRLAANTFKLEAVYVASDSGETQTREHVARRQPDGEWLMLR